MIYTHIKLKVVVVDIFSGGRNHQPDGSGPIHVQAYFFKVLERNFGGGLGSKQRKWARVLVVQCAEMGGDEHSESPSGIRPKAMEKCRDSLHLFR